MCTSLLLLWKSFRLQTSEWFLAHKATRRPQLHHAKAAASRLSSMTSQGRLLQVLASILALASIVVSRPSQAQEPAKPDAPAAATIAIDARLVNLPVVVRDKKGALLQNLNKDSFSLEVDGHPQTIRYFDRDSNLPLTLGLLVDTSRSVSGVLDDERTAGSAFLEEMLTSAADRAFVIQFARQTELLQDLTSSRPKLQAALKELATEAPAAGSSASDPDDANTSGPSPRRARGGGTTLYDAVFLASDELLRKQKGRKALVLLTDGEDRGSKENLAGAIEAAQRSDSIVYAIYFKGEEGRGHDPRDGGNGGGYPGGGRRSGGIGFPGGGYPGGGGGGRNGGGGYPGGGGRSGEAHVDGKKILDRITHETGGRIFEVKGGQTVADIYRQIAEELRSQYRLGFTPGKEAASDGYHQVDLTAPKEKGVLIQTRDGYYTGASQ